MIPPVGNIPDCFQHRFGIPEFYALIGDPALFQFHRATDGDTGGHRIQAEPVTQVIGVGDCFQVMNAALRA